MQEGSNANSLLRSPELVVGGELFFLDVILRSFQRMIEKLVEIDWFADDLFGGRGLSRLKKIPASNFQRRKPDDFRDAIHVPLHGEQALRRAKAAKCPMRRRVGGNGFGADANARPEVGSTGMNRASRQNHGRQRGVGAAIDGEIDFSA